MEQEKFIAFINVVSDMDEMPEQNKLLPIKMLFKQFFLDKEEISDFKELWFEQEEIKKDDEYYQAIISSINAFLNYCSDNKSFNDEKFAEEIKRIFQSKRFSVIYSSLIELSIMLDLGDKYYIEVICGLLSLGCKKGTHANKYLIETLEVFAEDPLISDSQYFNQIKTIVYENIDETFLKNLSTLFNFILSNEREDKIKIQINKIIENEEYGNQRKSSVSTNIENLENDINDNKIEEKVICCAEKKKSLINAEIAEKQNNESFSMITEKELFKEEKAGVNKNNEKASIISIHDKKKDKDSDSKDEISENTSIKQEKLLIDIIESNNTIKKEQNNSINYICDIFKKELCNYKGNEEKELIEKEDKIENSEKLKNYLKKFAKSMIQRQNRYNSILTQISELKRTIKEFVILQESQKDIYNDKIELEKNELIITGMKIVIESLKPPTIVNVKRKIIDMMIFALLKSNQNKFFLNKDYCPTKNFLEKVIEKLNKYKERKEISQSEKGKIDTKIKMLKDLIVKDKAIIKFPFTCSIGKLDYIMRYLGFCKGKYSDIVHISKESLKYYYLPFIDKIEP